MEKQILTVANNWLDSNVQSKTTTTFDSNEMKAGYYYSNTRYPYITHWQYSYTPKIQLKLSEIEKLRKVAQTDPDIKEILNKFTAHIEVLVDF